MNSVYIGLSVVVVVFCALEVYGLTQAGRSGDHHEVEPMVALSSFQSASGTPFFNSRESVWKLIDDLEEAHGGPVLSTRDTPIVDQCSDGVGKADTVSSA